MEKQAPKVSILILTTTPKKYRLVMKQISQEGWAIATVGNIKKALQMIITKKPSYVCLSVNFPGLPVLKIAQLITSNFNTPVILFPESFDFNTTKLLKEANWPHAMHVPMSGPSLRSKIKAMLREAGLLDDVTEKESNLKMIKADRAQESEDVLEYNASAKKKTVEIEEEGIDYSANKKKKFGSNINAEDEETYEEYTDAASGIKKRVPVFKRERQGVDASAIETDEFESYTDTDDLSSEEGIESYGFDEDTSDGAVDMSEIDSLLSAALTNAPRISAEEKPSSAELEESTFEKNFKDKSTVDFGSLDEDAGVEKPAMIVKKRELSEVPSDEECVDDESSARSMNSIAIELDQLKPVKERIQRSLDKCTAKTGKLEHVVQYTTDFVAFLVIGEKLNGIIYLAVGKDNAIGSGVTGVFLKLLTEDLRSFDLMAQCQRPVPIHIGGVNMRKWMLENCHFTIKAQHLADEILVGYIASENVTPAFGSSIKKDMFHVDVEKFSSDFPVNIDLYIHLPKNDKLIRYLMPGGYLDPEQKYRLTQKDVTGFHVHNKDLVKLRDYFIELFTKKRIAA